MSGAGAANALIHETSPYLLQHAHNPVQWYPWAEEALDRARREDKPILLSIGYSACHWCHVMAHESFEDERTAAVMNQHFVNIKVDREERPDIDRIYQTAHQLLSRRGGGWPLTMFLTPDDHVPFFGGTYFPPEPRYGMPAFRDLLLRVAEHYRHERDAIRRQNASMTEALRTLEGPASSAAGTLDTAPIHAAAEALHDIFDERFGGFGGAPKFPHPANLELLLHCWRHGDDAADESRERARHMVLTTLQRMALGGLYDQLGGGFSRYSVDDLWMIPHFEKMLYDNGPLLALYAEAWQLTGDPLFRRVAVETAEWVMREMQSAEGGYYSSLDADSEGEEGKFYVWNPEQVRGLLEPREFALISRRFGLDRPPNFENRHWHLHVFDPAAGDDSDDERALQEQARARLFAEREKRIRPGRDDKILTSWNGLMIRGMCTSALRLDRADFLDSAERAFEFIRQQAWRDGRLLATCKDGRARFNAYLDDYAFMLDAALTMLSCRWRDEWLAFAMQLAEVLLRDFEDRERGGFCFTSRDHERLIQRRRDFTDDALPCGNGIAAQALLRLGHLIGEQRYLDAAERTVRAAWDSLQRVPHAHNAVLLALAELAAPSRQIVLRGKPGPLADWHRDILRLLGPADRMYAIPADADQLPGLLAERRPIADPVAWICEGFRCLAPITDRQELAAALKPAKAQ
jgi:uncharacterized protein YyaL (SSP411 family)